MSKTVIKVNIRCPVVIYEEIIAVLSLKKSQIDTEFHKKHKVFQFTKFDAIFIKFSKDSVDWNVEKAQHGRNSLFSRLSRRDSCCFQISQIGTENDKNPKFSFFQIFHAIFAKFSIGFVYWNVEKTVIKVNIRCPVVIYEEIIAVLSLKKSQIDTEFHKKHKVFQFTKFDAIFIKFSTDSVDWNVEKAQHGRNSLFSRLSRRDSCCFQISQIGTENDKNPKFSFFQIFHAIFAKFSIGFVYWNVKNGHQGKHSLSSSHL